MKRIPRHLPVLLFFLIAAGCATVTTPPPEQQLKGVASWYGQEFAGRTTANGEIFDPSLLTAAHRTLPFGTIVDVKNQQSGSSVRVRINDRGPFIAGRVIDLSYAAARQIGLIEPGVGPVEIKVVKLGLGDREPPAPIDITVGKEAAVAGPAKPPEVPFPIPTATTPQPASSSDFSVTVEEERASVPTRRRVAADGRTIESVPIDPTAAETAEQRSARAVDAASTPSPAAPATRPSAVPAPPRKSGFVVQVGAFAVEANARLLQQQLARLGQQAHIDHTTLFRVRIGPFATREDAIRVRSQLEASGLSAVVTTN
ncbi:MAG TPA: septal ring lytic transglycosylase RlpA family protein [Thermoanaerobaculia bacterium]|nr:septal ring lytic transglycosylase RlpA family protein [Thermoanaerobaculia bacterium]